MNIVYCAPKPYSNYKAPTLVEFAGEVLLAKAPRELLLTERVGVNVLKLATADSPLQVATMPISIT